MDEHTKVAYHRHGNKVGLPDPWVLPLAKPGKRAP